MFFPSLRSVKIVVSTGQSAHAKRMYLEDSLIIKVHLQTGIRRFRVSYLNFVYHLESESKSKLYLAFKNELILIRESIKTRYVCFVGGDEPWD